MNDEVVQPGEDGIPADRRAETDGTELDQALFEMQAELCRTMGNAYRLMILHVLRSGERCVGDLSGLMGLTQPAISQHLAVMRKAGVVTTRRQGQNVFYRLADPQISTACDLMRGILERRVHSRSSLLNGASNR